MDDLISRADAIRIASGYCHFTNIPLELAKLPSAEKTGRWVTFNEGHANAGLMVTSSKIFCSECNRIVDCKTPYCPNCGAHMVEEGEQDEADNRHTT